MSSIATTDNHILIRVIIVITLIIFCTSLYGQNQARADSALNILSKLESPSADRIEMLNIVSKHSTSPRQQIEYSNRLLEEARALGHHQGILAGYKNMSYGYVRAGQIPQAITTYFGLLNFADSIGDGISKGDALANIAVAFKSNREYSKALSFELLALETYQNLKDTARLTGIYINMGNSYYYLEKPDSALLVLSEALLLDNTNFARPYIEGTTALVYAQKGELDTAHFLLGKSIRQWETYEDYYPIADCKVQFGTILAKNGRLSEAVRYLSEGYDLAKREGLKEQIQDGAQMLSRIYEQQKDYVNALKYQTEYYTYRDSLINAESIRRIGDERTAYEVGLKQAELDLANVQKENQQYFLFAVAGFALLILIIAIIVYRNFLEKKKVNIQLESQKEALEALNNTKDRFFSIISHDLRGPVQAFHGVSKLIKFMVQQRQVDQLEELAGHIDDSADRLSSLLDNLLSWAVQQQGQITYLPEKMDISVLCEDLVMTFGNMANGKNIELIEALAPNLYLWSDRNTTMTIFRNLISNALKFTPDGGSITFGGKEVGDMIEISVADTGVGIPEDKLGDLFKMQARESTWGTSGEKGLGLGLQLVKEFVDLNQGSISVESAEGEGTKFTILLPSYQEETVTART